MKQNIKVNNRLINYDLMRVIACFCVIMIHVGIYNQNIYWKSDSLNSLVMNFYGIISRWAVPCFVMLSGMMFLNKNREISIKKLYGKYILRLLISYVFWSSVYAAYNSIYEVNGGIKEYIKYFINNCFSGELHMWYIPMTIGLYIAMPIIKYVLNNASAEIIKYWIIVMFVFASVIPFVGELNIPYISGIISYFYSYMEIHFLCGYTLFFVLGYLFSTVGLSDKYKNYIYILGACGFIYSIFVLIILRIISSIEIGALTYLYPNIIFMSAAVFMFFKDKVSKVRFSDIQSNIISKLSGLSYGIYLVHVLVLKVLYHLGVDLSLCNIIISIPLITIITFVISTCVIFIVSKVPIVNKYIC